MDLAVFGITRLQILLLVLSRTAGIFTLTPTFGSNHIPIRVRIAAAVGLSIVFLPLVGQPGGMPDNVPGMALMMGREALVGLVIGFVCVLVFSAVEAAGHFVDSQSGFSFAASVDPANGSSASVASRFQNLFATLLFFVTNGHHVVIRGLADSFSIAPIGRVSFNPGAADGVLTLFAALFLISLKIAAPIIVALFLADLALAMLSRVVPQMNVFIVGLPLKLGLSLAGLMFCLPFLASSARGLFGDSHKYITDLVALTFR